MEGQPRASDDSTPYNDAARVDELIRYLEEKPPYEAIGKVVVAAAELELSLIRLALDLDIDSKKAWYRDKRAKFLRASGALPDGLSERIDATVEGRDVVSHGVWINLFEKGQGFLRPDKESLGQNLRGRLVDAADLEAWRSELKELTQIVDAARRR